MYCFIMEAGERLCFQKYVRQDIQKIFHGGFIVQEVIVRHIDGRDVRVRLALLIYIHI